MLEVFSGLINDYMAARGFPASNSASVAGVYVLKELLSKRNQNARDILLDEIRRGNRAVTFHSADDAAAITYRYMRAAEEGTARLNLRLLARVIVGSAEGPGLYADEFLRWADILAGLRREEVIVLGVMQRVGARAPSPVPETSPLTRFWNECCMTLFNEYSIESTVAAAYAASLMRTGFVVPTSDDVFTGIAFIGTHQLAELQAIMVIEGMLERAESGLGL